MLEIAKYQQIHGVSVYGDDRSDSTFYLLPNGPRFRTDEHGKPIFRFIKYRELRKEGEDFFGGLVTFDTCLSVPDETLAQVKAELQQKVNKAYQARGATPPTVQVGPPIYTGGTVTLNVTSADNKLIQKVNNAGVPSLYGDNVASFWVELTREGATIFEAAMRGEGGFVGVNYQVTVWAKLPPITGHAKWNASKFYSFVQEIDTDDNFWSEDSYNENIREFMNQHEVQDVKVDMIAIPGMTEDKQQELEDQIRSNLNRQLETAVERNMLQQIKAVDPDTKSLHDDQDIEDIKRKVSNTQIASISINLSETHTIEWLLNPQGTVPNITTMTGPDGPIKWEDYSMEIDLDDPFFQTLDVTVMVNADFAELPLFSVEAKLTYPHGDQTIEEFVFKSPDDVAHFRTFIVEKNKKYKFSYVVNYTGESRIFQSPEVETDDTQLTINVDDLGIWVVDIAPGDINFAQVSQAQVIVRLETENGPIERQFTMTEAAHIFQIREVTMEQRGKPYQYRVKYFMKDGKEFDSGWNDQDAPQLYINDPFKATKTVSVRAMGDLQNNISTINVDLSYADDANGYTQNKTVSLSADMPFFDWSFPVISETGGKVGYSGTIVYKDGTSREIPSTEADKATISLGDVFADKLTVTLLPDLIDFTQVKLAIATLDYVDTANGIDAKRDFVFHEGDAAKDWIVQIKDASKKDYQWSAKFFFADGSHRETPPVTSNEETLVLQAPAA